MMGPVTSPDDTGATTTGGDRPHGSGAAKVLKATWRETSGTTLALTGLALLGAAALVTTPFWVWYRRKRKRADEFSQIPPEEPPQAGT
jgi:hypothetical protein